MIERSFYSRDPAVVARELLGKKLVKNSMSGKIVETEAYYGRSDPASHAYNGKTGRNRPMYGKPGTVYVYLCYGMYHMLNFTAREEGKPGAVLIRAIEPLCGLETMTSNRNTSKKKLTNGPGKLTQAMGITMKENGQDATKNRSSIKVEDGPGCKRTGKSKRIGVGETHDRNLRFFCKESVFLSR